MLTNRYLASVKNLPAIMGQIVQGTAPDKFNVDHLKSIGFKSSGDRAVIPLLKELGFLTDDGTPTKRYHDYRDKSRSRAVMGQALRDAYQDLFHINEKPGDGDREAIVGKFKSTHNASDRVAELQAMTFFGFLKLADLSSADTVVLPAAPLVTAAPGFPAPPPGAPGAPLSLRYNIEVHLPPTKDVEVYNAIFKSLKEHLLA